MTPWAQKSALIEPQTSLGTEKPSTEFPSIGEYLGAMASAAVPKMCTLLKDSDVEVLPKVFPMESSALH